MIFFLHLILKFLKTIKVLDYEIDNFKKIQS